MNGEIFQIYYNNYSEPALKAVFNVMSIRINQVQHICSQFPTTLVNFLEQLKLNFNDSEDEYLGRVTNPIRFFAVKANNQAYHELAISLDILRGFISKDLDKLQKEFSKEIALLPGDNKGELFASIAHDVCLMLIDQAIVESHQKQAAQNIQVPSICQSSI